MSKKIVKMQKCDENIFNNQKEQSTKNKKNSLILQ